MIAGYGAFNTYYHNNILSQYPMYASLVKCSSHSPTLALFSSVTAWIGSVSSCITFAGATIGGTVMDRLGPRKVMMTGTAIMTIGFLALSWVSLSFSASFELFAEPCCAVHRVVALFSVSIVVHLVRYCLDVSLSMPLLRCAVD